MWDILAVCGAFDIDYNFVITGVPSELHGDSESVNPENRIRISGHDSAYLDSCIKTVEIYLPGFGSAFKDQALREGIKELVKMPEHERWKAVGALKLQNESPKQEKPQLKCAICGEDVDLEMVEVISTNGEKLMHVRTLPHHCLSDDIVKTEIILNNTPNGSTKE